MCDLGEDCRKLHHLLHECGEALDDKEWDQVISLEAKLLDVLNEAHVVNGVKLIALFVLVRVGMEEITQSHTVQ